MVIEYGRLFYMVSSASRRNVWHFVDFEPNEGDGFFPGKGERQPFCTCEAFHYQCGEPCRHIREVLDELLPVLRFLEKWNPKKEIADSGSKKKKYNLDSSKKYDPSKKRSNIK